MNKSLVKMYASFMEIKITWSVYIITNKPNGVLYVGETKRLKKRIYQHKSKAHLNTFSARYNLDKLVYFENHENGDNSKFRERQLKKWNREWKVELIEKSNADWKDLYNDLK